MRIFNTIFFILFTIHGSIAQRTWDLNDYSKWDHTNFRQNQIFNQQFTTANPDYLLLDAALYFMTNEERSKVGVGPMRYHKLLEVAAYNHSMKMATTGFFSHSNTVDDSRHSTSDRGKLAGVSNPSFAENIAYNYPDEGSTYMDVAEKLIDQWMNSPGHRDNILSPKGRQMGGGTYYLNGRIYGTQVFQWFNDVIENPYGGADQLPRIGSGNYKTPNGNFETTARVEVNQDVQHNKSNASQTEISNLKDKIAELNSEVSDRDNTIAKLNRDIAALQSEKSQLNTQYNNLQNESNNRKNNRSSRGKLDANEVGAITFKIGLNTFYPTIQSIKLSTFNQSLLSYGAETMLGINYGNAKRRNSIGVTLRASQTNRFLAQALDSVSTRPQQYFDAELTTLYREWFSLGLGATYISEYASKVYQISPAASMGICLGPRNWKLQLTQQVLLNSDSKIIGRASLGFALSL